MRRLGALIALAVAAAPTAAATPNAAPRPECVRPADRARVVRFRASDGTRLFAVTLGRGSTGVVLAHQRRASLCSWIRYARVLRARGFRVLAFDFRGHGFSGYPPYPRSGFLDRDVVAAARQLRRLGSTRIVLAGESMGGTAVLGAAAALTPAPAAVVSLSAPTVYGRVDGVRALSRLRVPVLLVAAENDNGFPEEARMLLAAGDPSTTRLEIVSGGAHGADMLRAPAVRDLVTAFVEARRASATRRLERSPHRNAIASTAHRRSREIIRTTLAFFRARLLR